MECLSNYYIYLYGRKNMLGTMIYVNEIRAMSNIWNNVNEEHDPLLQDDCISWFALLT